MTRLKAIMLLVTAAVLYGGIFPVNRLAAEAGWPAMGFALVPALAAGMLLLALNTILVGKLPITPRALLANVVIGGLVIGLPIGILVHVAEHLPASTVTLVLCLSPILTLIFATLAGSERFDLRVLFGMVLGTLGIVLIVWPESGILAAGGARWFILALLAPAMFALANNCAVWLRPPASLAVSMAAGTLLGGALIAALVAIVISSRIWPAEMTEAQMLPVALSTLIYAVFFWLFFYLIAEIGPARFSFFNYLAVAAGILWSIAIFGEAPSTAFWIAAVLMLTGMYLALSPKRKNSPTSPK